MTSARVRELQIRADLAEAIQRREDLQARWAVARYTSSGGERAEDLDVELARLDALILELEENLAAAPAPAPASDARPPEPAPEYVGTRAAAALLGISPRTLEGLRLRGEGPPHIRIGRRVLYPLASLRTGK